jgi:hypothetical protein
MPTVHHVAAEGPLLRSANDAIELTYSVEADWIAVPVQRLDPAFFDLSSGVAGEFVQKFVNYGQRLAIVGEIPDPSAALRDFVRECNRGRQVWVVADAGELAARLRAGRPGEERPASPFA